jgi:hypothetical protein
MDTSSHSPSRLEWIQIGFRFFFAQFPSQHCKGIADPLMISTLDCAFLFESAACADGAPRTFASGIKHVQRSFSYFVRQRRMFGAVRPEAAGSGGKRSQPSLSYFFRQRQMFGAVRPEAAGSPIFFFAQFPSQHCNGIADPLTINTFDRIFLKISPISVQKSVLFFQNLISEDPYCHLLILRFYARACES